MLIDELISFASQVPELSNEVASLSDRNLLCIDAMNVYEYASGLKWDDHESQSVYLSRHCFDLHMPNYRTWVEAKAHHRRKSMFNRIGCLFEICPLDDEAFIRQCSSVAQGDDGQKVMLREAIAKAAHLMSVSYYVSYTQGLNRMAYDSLIFLDPNFAPMKIVGKAFALTLIRDFESIRANIPGISDEEATVLAANEAYDLMSVPLVACTLLNVKNVVLRPRPVDQQLQKKRLKHGKAPLVNMQTLEVEAPGKRFIGGNGSSTPSNGSTSRPLHLVRGHLADYRDGNGLFGKYKGVYWMPAHFRGDIENGVIKKRYHVSPGE